MSVPDLANPHPLPEHQQYCVAGGNPAQLIRRRYSPAEVELLQRAAWWDWPIEVITDHASTLMTGTPAEIVAGLTRAGGMDL